jgi:hypothetical protein
MSMPTPAKRKRKRRPIRSTKKAAKRETSQHQIVRPPLIRDWVVELFLLDEQIWMFWFLTYSVMPIVSRMAAS